MKTTTTKNFVFSINLVLDVFVAINIEIPVAPTLRSQGLLSRPLVFLTRLREPPLQALQVEEIQVRLRPTRLCVL